MKAISLLGSGSIKLTHYRLLLCLVAMLFVAVVGLIHRNSNRGPQVFTTAKAGNISEDPSPKQIEPTGVPNREGQAIYLTDMTLCKPRTAIAQRFRQGAWKAITYETETLKGSMLYSVPGLASPPLTYPLKLQGWHAIYLGQHDSMQRYRAAGLTGSGALKSPVLKIKLSRDEHFSYVVPEHGEPFGSEQKTFSESDLTESFWRAADLSGQDLIVASTDIADANLSYIRLVPLQAKDVSGLIQDDQRQDTKRLMAVFDASSMSDWRSHDWILSQLAAFRNSDVGIVLWGTSCGFACYYPTKVGTPPRRQASPVNCYGFSAIYPRSELLLDIKVSGQSIDPLREAVDFGHKLGLKIYASVRPEGPLAPPDDEGAGEFYDDHPEYRCRSREGYPLAHLSLVYPEVRRKWVELLREQIRYGADGVSFVFVRGYPFVGYDPPATARFKDQYGADPAALKEDDPRWLRLAASYVTEFLREIRQMLNEEAANQRRSQLGTVYHVPDSPEESLRRGLDVKAWLDNDLVNYLVVQGAHPTTEHPDSASSKVVELFAPWTRGRCQLYANIFPRRISAEVGRQKAIAMYEAGADGLAFWDTDARSVRASEWAMIKKLGHRDELKNWKSDASRYFRVVPLKRLGDRVIDKFYQTNG